MEFNEEMRRESWLRREKEMKIVEFFRIFEIIKDIFLFLGYWHFSHSTSQNLQIKSLDFQFNQFTHSLHNLSITNHFI